MEGKENTLEEILSGKFGCGCAKRGAPVYLRRGDVYGETERLSSLARGGRAALFASRGFLDKEGIRLEAAFAAGGAKAE